MLDGLHPDVAAMLDMLVPRLVETLGAKLAGLYLYGSAVTGDFDHDISDLDLLAVLTSPLNAGEAAALDHLHTAITALRPDWEDRLDIAYVPVDALRTFRTRASTIHVISPGEPFHPKDAGLDWLMNWYLVQEHGVTLLGPPPATFIPPITTEEFIRAVTAYAAVWPGRMEAVRTRKGQAYAILTLCRALYAREHGAHTSKRRAAVWAAEELPEWAPLIRDALCWRDRWRDEAVDHDATRSRTRRFVRLAAEHLAR